MDEAFVDVVPVGVAKGVALRACDILRRPIHQPPPGNCDKSGEHEQSASKYFLSSPMRAEKNVKLIATGQ